MSRPLRASRVGVDVKNPARGLSLDQSAIIELKFNREATGGDGLSPDFNSEVSTTRVNTEVRANLNSDITNLRSNYESGDVINLKGNTAGSPDIQLSMSGALDTRFGDDLGSGSVDYEIGPEDIKNSRKLLKDIDEQIKIGEKDLATLKEKCGLGGDADLNIESNQNTIKNILGDNVYNNLKLFSDNISDLRVKHGAAAANLNIKDMVINEYSGPFGARARIDTSASGEFFFTKSIGPEGTGFSLEINGKRMPTAEEFETKIKPILEAEIRSGRFDSSELSADQIVSKNAVEDTSIRKAERRKNIEKTTDNIVTDLKEYQADGKRIGLREDPDTGELEITGIDESKMPASKRDAYHKFCDSLGLKRDGKPGARSRTDNDGQNFKNKKNSIKSAFKYVAAAGLTVFLIQNVFDCLTDGVLGDSNFDTYRDAGSCESVRSVILNDNDGALDTETVDGTIVHRYQITGSVQGKSKFPFLIRNFDTYGLTLNNSVNAGDHTAYYMAYPENSLNIDNFELPYVEDMDGDPTIVGRSSLSSNDDDVLKNCGVPLGSDGEIGNVRIDSCPAHPENAVLPRNVSVRQQDQWKKYNDQTKCEINYKIYQSALECSLENIIGETIRDLGSLTAAAIAAVADAAGDIVEESGNAFFDLFKKLLGPLGNYAMIILYVICGIICIIILYKIYKKTQG